MKRMSLFGAIGLAMLAGNLVGCNDKLKTDLINCQNEYNAAKAENESLRIELDSAQKAEALAKQDLAMARSDAMAARQQADQAQRDLEILKRQTPKPNGGPIGPTPQGWQETDRTARVTVGSDVLFSSGQATLTASGKTKVAEIAATVKSRFPGKTVLVYGYTDSDPITRTRNLWADNLDLSANRAMAVSRELTARGVAAGDIETVAMGQTHPVAPNDSAANKAKNRRVEIVVLK
jgi:flagellar motor protein MotB